MSRASDSTAQPAVVITGASKGIGEAAALALDRRGWRVFAGVRRGEDGEALRARASERLVPLLLDVTDAGAVAAAAARVGELAGPGLQGLVNNAGMVVAGPVEFLPLDELRAQLEVNLLGVLATTQAFLPLLRAGGGRILNVSSVNGRLTTPWVGAYCASKFALEALSDALRMELAHWRIPVVLIEPGAIATPIWSTAVDRARGNLEKLPPRGHELYGRLLTRMAEQGGRPPRHALPPERVAAKIAHALATRRPATRYLIGWDARIGALIAHLPGRLRDRLLVR